MRSRFLEQPGPSKLIDSSETLSVSHKERQSHPENLMHENGLTTLDQLAAMQVAVVQQIEAEDFDAARLKRLGICEGRQVQMVKSDDPLIIRVVGTRVGISARLAPTIHVRPCLPGEEIPHGSHSAPLHAPSKDQTVST